MDGQSKAVVQVHTAEGMVPMTLRGGQDPHCGTAKPQHKLARSRRRQRRTTATHLRVLGGLSIENARVHVRSMSIVDVDRCSDKLMLERSMRPSRRRRRLAWVAASQLHLRLAGLWLPEFIEVD